MEKHDEGRRQFLVRAAGAVAGAALAPEALAQTAPQAPHPMGAMPMHTPGSGHRAFFNDDDAQTVAAFVDRLVPSAPGKPGARDADVLNYIDLALAGAYKEQQDFYRRGVQALDAHCLKAFGQPFRRLAPEQQDAAVGALEQGKSAEFTWPTAQAFFNTLRVHTIEGMFSDPVYGGNKDFAGWKLVGFPGAQPAFSPEDLASSEAFTRSPIVGI